MGNCKTESNIKTQIKNNEFNPFFLKNKPLFNEIKKKKNSKKETLEDLSFFKKKKEIKTSGTFIQKKIKNKKDKENFKNIKKNPKRKIIKENENKKIRYRKKKLKTIEKQKLNKKIENKIIKNIRKNIDEKFEKKMNNLKINDKIKNKRKSSIYINGKIILGFIDEEEDKDEDFINMVNWDLKKIENYHENLEKQKNSKSVKKEKKDEKI